MSTLAGEGRMAGVGRVKLEAYGYGFIRSGMEHEYYMDRGLFEKQILFIN